MWFAKLALFPFSARELVWKTRRGAVCRILSSRISRDNTSRCDKLAARNNFVKETKMREAHKLGRNTSFRSQRTKPMGNWNHSCLPLFVRNTNQNLDFNLTESNKDETWTSVYIFLLKLMVVNAYKRLPWLWILWLLIQYN